jgi:hypothetical protein
MKLMDLLLVIGAMVISMAALMGGFTLWMRHITPKLRRKFGIARGEALELSAWLFLIVLMLLSGGVWLGAGL